MRLMMDRPFRGELRRAAGHLVCLLLLLQVGRAWGDSGDNSWNLRENGDDRFHSNEAWLRPWCGNDASRGQWQGNYSYDLVWGSTTTIGDGFTLSRSRDVQFHAWTYVYLQSAKTISFSGSGESVSRVFTNYGFDSPQEFTATLNLLAGWNRVDITGYNQNQGYTFHAAALAGAVDLLNHEMIDLTPVVNFAWSPSAGWSGTTSFTFTDTSTGSPDAWAWDVDHNGTVDYHTQNVSGHIYSAPDGGTTHYSVALEASRLSNAASTVKSDIITVYGKPIADFDWTVHDYLVDFLNTSQEPGKADLGGYSYAWDLDSDGLFDDSFSENFQWDALGPGDYDIGFQVGNGAGTSTVWKHVSLLAPVPEPSSMALAGLLGLFCGGYITTGHVRKRRAARIG